MGRAYLEADYGTQIDKNGNRKPKWGNGRVYNSYKVLHNVWEFPVGSGRTNHPAVFPHKLACDHIISWSNEGDLILDPFAGSGTTGLAAKNLNRQFILIEKEKEYYDICLERLK